MHESFGVCGVGGVEHTGAFVADDGGGAVVHVGGNVQAEPGMAVFVVVPAEEDLAVAAGGLDRVEPVWEVGPVLQRLELCFAERVVVAPRGAGSGIG